MYLILKVTISSQMGVGNRMHVTGRGVVILSVCQVIGHEIDAYLGTSLSRPH